MSKYYTNECVNCGFHCLYEFCPYYKVEHHLCDFCNKNDDTDTNVLQIDNYDICEKCYEKQETEKVNELHVLLYQWYILDWLKSRNLTEKDIDKETGVKKGPYKGDMYVCFEEFLDNEYCEDDIVDCLSQQNGYKNFQELCEEKKIDEKFL